MKRFSFRLQPVLKLRGVQEELAAQVLGGARRAEAAEREQLACLESLRDAVESELQASSNAGMDPRHASAYLGYLARLQGRIAAQDARVGSAAQESENCREILIQASLERRKIERLRERRMQEHEAAFRAAEERELDDLRTARSRRGGWPW